MPAAIVENEPLTDDEVERVNRNLGLVRKLAGASKDRRIDFDDRYQAGCLGLIRAVQLYGDGAGKAEWPTYAAGWIRQAIQRAAAKMKPLASIGDLDGFEPVDVTEASDLDPTDAERLRAVVASLPDQPRAVVIDKFWRNRTLRGAAKVTEEFALKALRAATQNGRSIPATAPWWTDRATGEPLRSSRMNADDAKALKGLRLLPRYPAQSLSTLSECPHRGPIPRGSLDYCEICGKSGQDGISLPESVKPLPIDRPKPPPKPAKAETRKQRRARGKAA